MNQPLAGFAPAPVTARMENHGNHMLKVAMQTGNDLLARVGSMVAYEGFVQYEPNPPAVRQIARDWMTGEGAPLMKCSGDGLLYLADYGANVVVINLNGDAISVNATTASLTTAANGGTEPTLISLGSALGTIIALNTATGAITLNYAPIVAALTATPAGGSTAARLLFGTTTGFGVYYGSGAPTVAAAQGSIYIRSDGSSTSTRLYVNTTGSTTWTNFTSAT